ncbi:MAG: SDR family oxidoreductase [Candidatus Thermoplasmatota archaeon]|nr:SDR family oxidoreductase [Candidatus Thermoplasmatota archaeon]
MTGASLGIGREIATLFAVHGAYIGLNYHIHKNNAQQTIKKIREHGGDGILLQADVSKRKEVKTMVQTLMNEKDHIDILVNNAGIYQRNTFAQITPDTWNHVIDVNLSSCYHLCQESLPFMPQNSRIIFISSQLAFRGSSHGSDYATTKAGMLGLMRSLAMELADKKILVNAVAPGTIDTDIISHYTQSQRHQRIQEIPLKRLGTPKDIANACLFLASDLSSYITGETIHVNGGLYIH